MAASPFAHVRTWVFDLDNTLYPESVDLFAQIRPRMTLWLMHRFGIDRAEADHLREDYWERYGTTLAGLVAEHRIDPAEFLAQAHDIDLSALIPDPRLAGAIGALPGRRVVFTNGNISYAARVLARRGLDGAFDAIYCAEHTGFISKPTAEAFSRVFALEGLVPRESAMFEDDPRNLAVPHGLGLRTVLVGNRDQALPHIDHRTGDLASFLATHMSVTGGVTGGPIHG